MRPRAHEWMPPPPGAASRTAETAIEQHPMLPRMIDTIDALAQWLHHVRGDVRDRRRGPCEVQTQKNLAGKGRVAPPSTQSPLGNCRRTRMLLLLRMLPGSLPTPLGTPASPRCGLSDLSSPTDSAASNTGRRATKQAPGRYMHRASGSNPAAAAAAAKRAQLLVGSQGIGSAAAAAPYVAAKTLNGTTMNCEEAEAIR